MIYESYRDIVQLGVVQNESFKNILCRLLSIGIILSKLSQWGKSPKKQSVGVYF